MDAFCILVLSVLEQESKTIKGYIELFSEQMLNSCYHERIQLVGEKRLGVILADKYRQYSTIVIKAQNAAEVLYHDMTDDPIIVARKVIELAKKHEVPLSDQNIFVDKAGRGRDLCVLIASYAQGNFIVGKYEMRQKYGIDVTEKYQYNDGLYEDQYAAGYAKIAKWLRNAGRLIDRPMFDDLLSMIYTDQSGKMKMIDKDTLLEQGIDASIPDALALTTIKEKREINRPREDDYWEEDLS